MHNLQIIGLAALECKAKGVIKLFDQDLAAQES